MDGKLDPWNSTGVDDYQKLFSEFGIGDFERFKDKYRENRYIRRGIIFGQRDFERIDAAIKTGNPFAMMTGLMPSGRFHFGHKMVADQIIYYQKLGAKIYLCSADLEAYLVRGISFSQARQVALEEYLLNYLALGLGEKDLVFCLQSDYDPIYCGLRDILSSKTTLNELRAIYGDLSPAKILSVLTQAADILHCQLDGFEGPLPVVVPVGPDQDPHIRLTRDFAARFESDFGFIRPSSTYHKFMRGLEGGKMSSSDPKTHIALTEDPTSARKKIMKAKTGGRTTVEEQRETGGIPENCIVYEFFVYHLVEDDSELENIYSECKRGKILCGECKKRCAELMENFLISHQEKREKLRGKAEKIMGLP